MTTRRVAQISCDKCGTITDLASPRGIKPVGWARITISVKTDQHKPVEVIQTADLCPNCLMTINDLLDEDEGDDA